MASNIVNTVVDIYWPEDKAWYRAKLTGFDPTDCRHYIAHHDDDSAGVSGWATLSLDRPADQSPTDHLQYRPAGDTTPANTSADCTGDEADTPANSTGAGTHASSTGGTPDSPSGHSISIKGLPSGTIGPRV